DDLESALESSWLDVSRATHRFLSLLREFDLRRGWQAYGCTDCAQWLDFKLKLSRTTALEKLRVAKALWFVPLIDAAFKSGALSYSQVRALTRVADEANEADLLAYARTSTAEQLEQCCKRLRHGDACVARQIARRDHEARSVALYPHSGEILVKLPAEAFALVEQALARMVDTLPEDPTRGSAAARADAFMELIARARAADAGAVQNEAPESVDARANADRGTAADYQVLVHVDAQALSGAGGESDLPLPIIRRLCCEGTLVPVLKNGQKILDVGRKQRTVPLAIRRALAARDRSCRFPGCHHTRWLDAHHIHHWCDGGETSLDNLILLCSHHHKQMHEGGFRLRATSDGYYFARPDGRPVEGRGTEEKDCAFSAEEACPSSAEDLATASAEDFSSPPTAEASSAEEGYQLSPKVEIRSST
ncbi:MAG: DUF222 domain-containing protein, partial [Pseudomonadales bacterium]|nr:DUF222 domain-containing protein [Pseudomonadales bacterium]